MMAGKIVAELRFVIAGRGEKPIAQRRQCRVGLANARMLDSNMPRVAVRLLTYRAIFAGIQKGMPDPMRSKDFAHPVGGKTLGDAVEGDLLAGCETDLGLVQTYLPPVHQVAGSFEFRRCWRFATGV